MKLIHRFGYFGLGLFFGIVILIFFLGGKKASCNYGPNARVLSNIRSKDRAFSENSIAAFQQRNVDTSVVAEILENGDIDFSKSDTHRDSCNIYFIGRNIEKNFIELEIENCDSLATIRNTIIKKDS